MRTGKTKIMSLIGLIITGAVASGCGQQAYLQGTGAAGVPGGQAGSSPLAPPGTTTTTGTGTTTNIPSTLPFDFRITGTGTAPIPSVDTSTVLQITVTAGQPLPLSGTGFTIGFNCERFTVSALGLSRDVWVKRTGYFDSYLWFFGFDPCNGATDSAMVDFSARLTPGHNAVNVTVSHALYDNCASTFSDTRSGGCPMAALHFDHTVAGHLSIQTNTFN